MKYDQLANQKAVDATVKSLEERKYEVAVVENGSEALKKIQEIIPDGATVMNGSSVSLEEIGLVEYLKTETHGWRNLHAEALDEKDPAKQAVLRKQATLADYYLGSVHALSQDGEMVIASNTASQLPSLVFSSQNVILVIGTQKIVPTLTDALDRLETYVVPLEDVHMQEKFGVHTVLSKILIFKRESPFSSRKIHIILVKEKLGF